MSIEVSNGCSGRDPSFEAVAESLREIRSPTIFYVATVLGEQDWLSGHNILVSAGTAWRNPGSSGEGAGFDINVPENDCLFVDSGGFQAAVHYGDEYPYSPRELFEWAESIGADYVAGMDWACEREEVLQEAPMVSVTTDNIASVPERIERTIDDQIEQAKVYKEGNWSFEFVPAVQGYTTEDYRYCARRLRRANVARSFMSIGSVCKRDSPDQILRVLETCREELPHTEFHLFGATRRVWKDRRINSKFVSADTHAWAASHPDGGWPSTNAEKKEAFEHFRDDIESVQDEIDCKQPLGQSSDPVPKIIAEMCIDECACGTKIPVYGTDFEPQCRHCEQIELNRWSRNLSAMESVARPAETRTDDQDAQCQLGNIKNTTP